MGALSQCYASFELAFALGMRQGIQIRLLVQNINSTKSIKINNK